MNTIRLSEIQRNKNKTFSVKLSRLFSLAVNIFPKIYKLLFSAILGSRNTRVKIFFYLYIF